MKKIILLLSLILINVIPNNVLVINAAEETSLTIYKTVDEDLKDFNFDYTKYYVNPDLVYRPIVIQFNESTSENYSDLLYLYDPNNSFDLDVLTYDVYYGDSSDKLDVIDLNLKTTLYHSGVSEDGKVKRLALNTFDEKRNEYKYRKYILKSLDDYEIYSVYMFDSNYINYSNCINLYLENPHNWSWHFDEDTTWWENFKDSFKHGDTLKDQLFYSFYIPAKWDVSEIKSIDLKYKKVLLEGYRANIADTTSVHDFYQNENDELYKPKFYKWNENNTSASNYDRSMLLGYSLNSIANKVNYTFKTIEPLIVRSDSYGVKNDYVWNSIQDLESFERAFGKDSEIYKFATENYIESQKDNYWIINYDKFYYTYQQEMEFIPGSNITNHSFYDWCVARNVATKNNVPGVNGGFYDYYLPYSFSEEYTFDISATSITYEDSLGISKTLAVSVAPVLNKEGSGGTSTNPFPSSEDFLETFKKILSILLLVFGFLFIGYAIYLLCSLSSNYRLKKTVKQNNKLIDELYKNKKRE